MMSNQSIPTLYTWMGGDTAIFETLIENFYNCAVADPLLKPLFEAMPLEHRHRVAAWFAEVFGGPKAYSGENAGHSYMVEKHLNLSISEKQRERWAQLMQVAADMSNLPKD